mgnify:CR=1 FL=1
MRNGKYSLENSRVHHAFSVLLIEIQSVSYKFGINQSRRPGTDSRGRRKSHEKSRQIYLIKIFASFLPPPSQGRIERDGSFLDCLPVGLPEGRSLSQRCHSFPPSVRCTRRKNCISRCIVKEVSSKQQGIICVHVKNRNGFSLVLPRM